MGKKGAKVANGDTKKAAPVVEQADKAVKDVIKKGKKTASSVAAAVLPEKKVNGKAKKEISSDEESSGSESDDEDSASESSDSDSSESESDSEVDVPVKKEAAKAKRAAPTADDSSDDGSSDDDSEMGDAPVNGKAKAGSDSEEDSDASSDDGSASDASEEPSPKKRKAEAEEKPIAKKAKTVNGEAKAVNGGSGNGIKNLFVGNLSWNIDEEWLAREFEGYGEIERVNIITDKNTGRSKGYGYVEFTTVEDAQKAHDDMKGKQIDGRDVNIDYSTPRTERPDSQKFKADSRAKSYGDQTSPESDTLFVGNVSFEADENILGEAFGQWGTVRQVRLPTDRDSGNLKGFGYVQFASVEEAKVALENMRGAEIAGRSIRLDFTTPRDNSGGGGRGGGFGGRGRGGGGFGGRGDFGGRGRGGGGFGGRGRGGFSRGGGRGGRGGSTNRGGFGDFSGRKTTFD